ncbi:hypothetical protein Pyn_24176 [Prunus yedoensis var. nudiflora]|uniref:Uncharacterized protein n=1 Tax=Prunus yedoensis var. nudiflora TaxID=2094558 RepID=A0A314UT99_PRUYE|nr:hypothetical protein Pyn_24176 [Prunus yedoensis var. nudiflora]
MIDGSDAVSKMAFESNGPEVLGVRLQEDKETRNSILSVFWKMRNSLMARSFGYCSGEILWAVASSSSEASKWWFQWDGCG